ncbi:NAD(P)/FAD-dependent oxidoreductase [Agrobacterium tumefaciens]|uniref:NAD(P)/FAD-dependent oxidoreductase n=1 Tax=Agrobacterium tumefaciens TaxID=358 RepID=UPI0021CE0954|nr:FAD-dependent oxidoreductase [Agrobacterium tumefaciens]UXS04639.1 FAD-binding oxidoreductase [Agrobacterium tumefaciens]
MSRSQLTKERDLREFRPVWMDSPRISVRTRNTASLQKYDVIIVGAGISGALVAHAVAQSGKSVLIIDKGDPVRGSSIASTAMIQHEIDVPLHQLQKMIGKADARRVWQRSAQAVLRLEEIVKSLDISCSMRRKKALYLAGNDYGSRALKMEAEARAEAGIDAKYLGPRELRECFDIERTGAILSNISASANPGQLTAGLLRHLARRKVEIVSGVEVTDMKDFSDGVVLATGSGKLLIANHAVFCTGYEFLKVLESKRHEIISTWALASDVGVRIPDWLHDHIVWEASDPYLYLRTDQPGRLIAGGEDEHDPLAFQDGKRLQAKTYSIRIKLAELLNVDIGQPAYRWAAAFGSTTTGLPLIGNVPGHANVYSVMGFGGNGITFSQIAADIVAAAINGVKDPDSHLFDIA